MRPEILDQLNFEQLISSGLAVLGGIVAISLTCYCLWLLIRRFLAWIGPAFGDRIVASQFDIDDYAEGIGIYDSTTDDWYYAYSREEFLLYSKNIRAQEREFKKRGWI